MELTGKCIKVLPSLSGKSAKTGDTWNKYFFVIETQGQFTRRTVFTVFGEDKWKQMGIVVGGEYQVSFDIDAREWNGKWFNDVSAWRAVRVGAQQQQTQAPAPQQAQSPVHEAPTGQQKGDGSADDLPF